MLQPFFKLLARDRLTVMLFHKVPVIRSPLEPGEIDLVAFDCIIEVASRIFTFLPLDEAVTRMCRGTLPSRAACITFDDGYPDWAKGALPVLKKHGAHATFFITTGQFNGKPMWSERILHAVANASNDIDCVKLPDAFSRDLPIRTVAERRSAVEHLNSSMKYMPQVNRDQLIHELEIQTNTAQIDVPTLSVQGLRDLHSQGFGIGGHSITHPILTLCDERMAYEEIGGCREELESLISGCVRSFAYPNGLAHKDFDQRHVDMVRRAGYACAVTTMRGAGVEQTSPFQVPRFTPWGPTVNRMLVQFARNFGESTFQFRGIDDSRNSLVRTPNDGSGGVNGKRILMVAFHFPPQSGSSGVLRTLNFTKYLPQNGWGVTVLTASASAYEKKSSDLLDAVPREAKILRALTLDAARHLSIKGKYLELFALPDRWSSWIFGGIFKGIKAIRDDKPQLIWSTYPIATAHLIAAGLHQWSGVPWVADFRDPMTTNSHPPGGLKRSLIGWIEKYSVKNANLCVFTTENAADLYRERYPTQADKCVVIENGYDEEVFADAKPNRFGVPQEDIFLLHSGVIYPEDRDPSEFFRAIRGLIDEGQLQRHRIRIRFRAPVHEVEVSQLAIRHGIEDLVETAPQISYSSAIEEMLAADLLLIFQGCKFNSQIPAKAYEYLRAGRTLLGLVDVSGNTAALLAKFDGVFIAPIDDSSLIKSKLQLWMKARARGISGKNEFNRTTTLQPFTRKAQAQQLANKLDALIRPIVNQA